MRVGEQPPERAVDALWREHGAAVIRYARRRVSPADVDDVVAETFVVAWRRRSEVPDQPLPWLLGVARGVSANLRRAQRRREALQDRLTAAVPADIAGTADIAAADVTAALRSALDRLRETDRELLLLLAWDGLTHDDAARALGCSRGALTVRLHRARRRLCAELDRTGDPAGDPAGNPAEDPAEDPAPVVHPHALTGRS